ncbi:hypothetical protein MRX96_008789 [Rhipicephalus microplus]
MLVLYSCGGGREKSKGYLIKWKGYSKWHCTLEPKRHLNEACLREIKHPSKPLPRRLEAASEKVLYAVQKKLSNRRRSSGLVKVNVDLDIFRWIFQRLEKAQDALKLAKRLEVAEYVRISRAYRKRDAKYWSEGLIQEIRAKRRRCADEDSETEVPLSVENMDGAELRTELRALGVNTTTKSVVKRKRPDPKSRDFPAPPGPECSGLCDLPGAENIPEDLPTKQFYKDKVLSSQEEITQLKKKVKTLQQTKRRLVKRNETTQEIIKEIREQKLLSEEGSHVFSSVFSDDIQQLLCRVGNEQKGKYPPELRAFALTLHFYSPAAYEYVRSKYNEALSSQRTLRGWYKSIQGAPGFTAEAFAFLEKFAEARDKPFYCALIVDDMAIRKHVELVGDKVVGYVDFGTGLDDDGLPEAANACVFMIVGINVRFKMPVGYFLIDSLTGAERAELAKQCIEKLASVKAEVFSLTFDGASSNFTMARCLGAQLRVDCEQISSSFVNPADDAKNVYIILDACHMSKLIRNSLANLSYIVDAEGKHIKWAYIVALEALQRSEGLRLGNKLTKVHVQWEKQKMKVRYAAQALSSSVADALDFCENVLKLPQFRGASATSMFVRVFDHLFDLFNSRNPFARSYKAPLRKQNEACWKPFFAYTQAYIKGLRDPAGRPVLEGLKKKTGFVGFLICMASTEKMFDELVGQGKLKYLLTHKLSQDHAENFFGSVRSRGGYNNNPTAAQFMAAYKRLLVQTEVTSSSSGNCTKDMVSILNATTVVAQVDATSALTDMRRSSILESHDDHDYTHPENLSAVVVAVVPYIAGFVKLEQHILDLDPLDNHIYSLCKKVAELYVKIRIHHMTKERNREIIKDRVRSVLSRMTIFKHQ